MKTVTEGYDVQFVARPLKRAIQTYIEDGISELIVNGDLQAGATILRRADLSARINQKRHRRQLFLQFLCELQNFSYFCSEIIKHRRNEYYDIKP